MDRFKRLAQEAIWERDDLRVKVERLSIEVESLEGERDTLAQKAEAHRAEREKLREHLRNALQLSAQRGKQLDELRAEVRSVLDDIHPDAAANFRAMMAKHFRDMVSQ